MLGQINTKWQILDTSAENIKIYEHEESARGCPTSGGCVEQGLVVVVGTNIIETFSKKN